MKLFVHLVALIAILILAGISIFCTGPQGPQGSPGPQGPPGPPGVATPAQVSRTSLYSLPMSGKGGEKITIYGSGFAPGEKVKLQLAVEGITLQFAVRETGGVVQASQYGAFVLIPSGFPLGVAPGVYTLEAIGDKGSRATAPLEILK